MDNVVARAADGWGAGVGSAEDVRVPGDPTIVGFG